MPNSEAARTLHDLLVKIREALLDALTWLSDQCVALLDWLSQAGPNSPSHQQDRHSQHAHSCLPFRAEPQRGRGEEG